MSTSSGPVVNLTAPAPTAWQRRLNHRGRFIQGLTIIHIQNAADPVAAQQLPPSDPVAAAIRDHKHADAAYLGAFDRLRPLVDAVDPGLDIWDNDDAVRTALTTHYGDDAPARIDELVTARDVSSDLGDVEDEAWTRFADVPLSTPEQVGAYAAHVKAHAATQGGSEVVFLWQALDRLAAMLSERLEA